MAFRQFFHTTSDITPTNTVASRCCTGVNVQKPTFMDDHREQPGFSKGPTSCKGGKKVPGSCYPLTSLILFLLCNSSIFVLTFLISRIFLSEDKNSSLLSDDPLLSSTTEVRKTSPAFNESFPFGKF